MERIELFDAQHLKAACKILADTQLGLTGSEIGYILADCRLKDLDPQITKWKRLFNALAEAQNQHQVGNHLIMFITRALNPVSYSRDKNIFNWRKNELNIILAFSGFQVGDDGKVRRTAKEATLKGALARANALKNALEDRKAHAEIFKYCQAELLENNYFHAVLEAIKGVAERVRDLSGLGTDGAELINTVFSVKTPILAINNLQTETEISEQKGFSNILVGLFGTIRNPTAHAPKIVWPISEQDALDIFSLISFIHRKLDIATKT